MTHLIRKENLLQIRSRGGQCIPVRVDHENANEIEALFQRIANEQDGRLDILVNNAYKGVDVLKKKHSMKISFTIISLYSLS